MTKAKKILIVGGVAGGASAAARARRLSEEAEIILFERGEYISFANCGLPYYIGGTIKDKDQLLIQTPEKMRQRFNIDIRTNSEVIAIDRTKQEITVQDKIKNQQYQESYDALILSPGANPIRPPIPGIDNPKTFTLRTIPDMDKINNFINTNSAKNAVVVGGGYIGLEMAENLRERGLNVTLVELLDQVMAPIDKEMAKFLQQELIQNGVNLKLETAVTGFKDSAETLQLQLSDNTTITCDFAILAIGVQPETALAKAADLAIGKRGGIAVDATMCTNDPNIYAIGDAIEVTEFVSNTKTIIPLAGPANRQGRIAADNVLGYQASYKNTQGTGVCKIFNQAVAMTGLNEKTLQKLAYKYEKIYLHNNDHVSYYPGASMIHLKLLFSPNDGQIFGAQAIGEQGVARRIDILAMAIRAKLTVFDLTETELCYAPPYGSAKDIINYAGFVAANVITGKVKICHSNDMQNPTANQILLDVRTKEEFNAGTIPGSVNIPVDELRSRLSEIAKDKELLVFCRVGLRGYLACRILEQNGFTCRNLTGGYLTYRASI